MFIKLWLILETHYDNNDDFRSNWHSIHTTADIRRVGISHGKNISPPPSPSELVLTWLRSWEWTRRAAPIALCTDPSLRSSGTVFLTQSTMPSYFLALVPLFSSSCSWVLTYSVGKVMQISMPPVIPPEKKKLFIYIIIYTHTYCKCVGTSKQKTINFDGKILTTHKE